MDIVIKTLRKERSFNEMRGHFYRRGCTCKRKNCICGSKWAFVIDIGINPVTGKRKQKTRSRFNTQREAKLAAAALIRELNQEIYVEETDMTFCEFANQWLPIYSDAKDVKPGTNRVRIHESNKLLPNYAQLKLKDITRKRIKML